MSQKILMFLLMVMCQFLCTTPSPESEVIDADVVIYGGTSAAVIAAVQCKQMGKSVVIVCPETHIGGLSSSGLGWTDTGKKEVIGGLSREFYHRVWKKYQDKKNWKWQPKEHYGRQSALDDQTQTAWNFEPHIAEEIFEELVKEYQIPVYRYEWLDREKGVESDQGRIVSITMLSGKQFAGKMFCDAGYEGDLMAAAGVGYTVGRESNSQYGETLNGNQVRSRSHQFLTHVDPFVKKGDPSSGLLPRISKGGPGKLGEGDKGMQAYCYRMCLTRHPDNKVSFKKPDGYDVSQYELLLRTLLQGNNWVHRKFDPIPNAKTDTNNSGSFSTDNIGMNYEYPEASYAKRQEILKEHQTYQQGYLYFLANDPRVPERVRDFYQGWGLAKDEFADNDHWPYQIYVREARRLLGTHVMTQNHLQGKTPTPESIGMGSYTMDSHNVRRYAMKDPKTGQWITVNEGDVQVPLKKPYSISLGSILPKKQECGNLFVPCAVSASHIAYGSIRMEPVFMILGQSGATAACMAIDKGIAVQDVDYNDLKARLLKDKQVLVNSVR